ncbi:MAG: pyruvate formate lyase family protein [bacterium]
MRYVPSSRIRRLRERAVHWQEPQRAYIGQRLYHAMAALTAEDPATPLALRQARMLAGVIRGVEPIILDDELLVGYNYLGEGAPDWGLETRDSHTWGPFATYIRQGRLTEEQVQFIETHAADVRASLPQVWPLVNQPADYRAAEEEGVIWAQGTANNHTVIGYARVLNEGFESIREEVAARLRKVKYGAPDAQRQWQFLRSALIVADAACEIGQRYAQTARLQADACEDATRRAELLAIAVVCEQVPARPARSFREAVQSLWFAHIMNTWEDGINANSLGRLDQILYPYYQADITAGRLTNDEACELLSALWLKIYRDYDVQQVTLGGVDADGHDATNELTYLMLDVTEQMDFIRCLSVRLHAGTPDTLLTRSLELVAKGQGIPFFFNDDVIIPALVDAGIPVADARDYAPLGCIELTIPGKSNPHAVSNRVNLLKCLELALNDGRSQTTGAQAGPHTGDPSTFTSMEDVLAAYRAQVEHFTALACRESLRLEDSFADTSPLPYKSLLTEGCIETARDFNDAGARYNYHQSMAMGIPNVADSLAVLRDLVFTQAHYTLPEMLAQLRADWPDERARLEALNRVPKFGNGEPAVDSLAADVFRHFCEVLTRMPAGRSMGFHAQPFTYLWLIDAGRKTGATSDGRHAGENIAYSISPMQGRDHAGLTALLRSLAALPQTLAAGCTSAIVETEPVLFAPEHRAVMVAVLRAAIASGVGQLQFNVVSAETLLRAQANPDNYRNLAVRVSGFSQRFCLLSQDLQDHIIARTKHAHA